MRVVLLSRFHCRQIMRIGLLQNPQNFSQDLILTETKESAYCSTADYSSVAT